MDFTQPLSALVALGWNAVCLVILVILLLVLQWHRRHLRDAESDRSSLRAALDLFPDAFVLVDAVGHIAFANPQTATTFGLEPAELANATLETLIPRDVWEGHVTIFNQGQARGQERIESVVRRFVGKHKSGRALPLEAYFAPLPNRRGGLSAAVLFRDVSRSEETEKALRQSEAHLRMVIEQMPAIIWTTDTELCLTSTQGAGLAALNLQPDQVIGMSMLEHLERDNMDATPVAAHAAALRGQSLNYEMEWKERTFQVAVEPLRDATKKIAGTIGVVVDVTARKQTLAELETRASQQAAVADLGQRVLAQSNLTDLVQRGVEVVQKGLEADCCGFWELAADGKALRLDAYADKATKRRPAVQAVGAGRDSLEGYTLLAGEPLRIEDIRTETDFAPGPFLTKHRTTSCMSVVVTARSGPVGVLVVYCAALRKFNGHDLHFLQAVANTLAMARDHRQVEEEQRRLVAILEATPDFVGIADRNRRMLYLNRAGRDMVGLNGKDDISRKNFADFYAAEARRVVLEQGIGTAVAESFWSGETALLSPARGLVPISQVIVAHKETDGTIKYFSTIARDISKLKRLEEQFLRAQKMEAVGRLAGGVAHDFNNLLTVIMGFSEALIKSLDAGDARQEQAHQIKRSSERAAALTRQLLTFSRHQGIEPQTLHLGELVTRMSKMLGHIIGEDIELIARIASDLKLIKADPGQMEQVVMNLVVNARDAMPTGGKITIEAANVQVDTQQAQFHLQLCPGDYVRLSVRDTGCGMDDHTQSHLFEPFFTTKEMGKGTGLGLAIVYGVVQQSRGYLEVDSSPGHGSTFHIYFPVSRQHAELAGRPVPAAPKQSKGTETILVVEDQEGVRSLVQQSLEAEGYHVLVASDGQEALATCNSAMRPIHLLLTDVVMPRMSGPQLAKSIANLSPATKVLYMSGFADSALSRHGALAEGIDCLMKPFTPEVLVRMVREVLDGRRVPALANGR